MDIGSNEKRVAGCFVSFALDYDCPFSKNQKFGVDRLV